MHVTNCSFADWLERNPDITRVEAFLADINGSPKGKWLERDKALAIESKGLPMPLSVFAQDAWGCDVPAAGLAFGTGDPDGLCRAVPGRFARAPWLGEGCAQLLIEMQAGETPADADPRGALQRVLARYAAHGLVPVVATEQEFYLYRLEDGLPVPPDGNARRNDTLSTAPLARHRELFDAIFAAAAAFGIPVDGLISEAGPGQFEINLLHRADALATADDAILLRRLIRDLARREGLGATFMAKPYADASGSGMHIHASVLDPAGKNVLAQGDGRPSDVLHHAVAGLVRAMPDTMLAFAPNANSFRRIRPDAHAPISAGWGIDDRSAAVRVIVGDAKSTRIEHRIAGADANPYIALAAMLGAMIEGIEKGEMPPPAQDPKMPTAGERLPVEWGATIDRISGSAQAASILGERFRDIFVACKRQDRDEFLNCISRFEYDTYLSLL